MARAMEAPVTTLRIDAVPNVWVAGGREEGFYRALDELALAGFDGIELTPALLERFGRRTGGAGGIERLLRLHGLELSALCCAITCADPKQVPEEVEALQAAIDVAARAGANYLVLDGVPKGLGGEDEERVRWVANGATRIGERCRAAGLRCGWHPHYGSIFERPTAFDQLMAETDPALVGFCPDTAQLVLGGYDVGQTLRRYAGRIGHIHLKDVAPNPGFLPPAGGQERRPPQDEGAWHVESRWRFVELGWGIVDFDVVATVLREAGYAGWLGQDLDYTPYATLESACALTTYLRQFAALVARPEA